MEIPKILWLKNNMPPERFSNCQFFDLPDYLTYRATASRARSACSLTCKCSFVPDKGWQKLFFNQIGLEEVVNRGYEQIGGEGDVLTAGMPVGNGLSAPAAKEMGLLEGTPVGSGVIDAWVFAPIIDILLLHATHPLFSPLSLYSPIFVNLILLFSLLHYLAMELTFRKICRLDRYYCRSVLCTWIS